MTAQVASISATPDLEIIAGQITTTSTQVAAHFNKRHDNVLRAIRNIGAEADADFYRRNFEEVITEFTNGKGGTQKAPAYRITRDGFALLAMGFTGKEAMQWKLAYLPAFNKMERELLARTTRPHNPALDYDRISPAQAQDLKELVHAVVDSKVQGFGETWARLHRKFRVNSYLELPAARFEEARDYLLGKLPEQDRAGTVNELVAEWVRKIEAPNGYPASLFQPIVDAVQRKLGHQLPPGKMIVDRQKLAAVWSDLGKLRNRIDGLGILESDLPPSWWQQQQISA